MVEGCSCSGSGILEKDGKLYECVCALLKRRAASMPPFIRTAELRPEHTAHKLHTQVKKSLYVLATWQDMKAIVKAVMICHMNLFVRVTSDNDILHAYVGAMSKKNKGENEATFETVGDFVGPPDLVIVRLNALTRPNKAAAGALEEAMVCRTDQDKPTWLVSDMERPFTENSPAYSGSLWDLMEVCGKVRIAPVLPRNLPTGVFDLEPVETAPDPAPKKATPAPERSQKRSKPQSEQEDDLSVYGVGIKKSKGSFGRGDD